MAPPFSRLLLILTFHCFYYSVDSSLYCSMSHIGAYGCVVQLQVYDAPVYATCLTDSYAKLKNNNEGACRNYETNEEVDSCWFSCMMELHGKDKGHVTNDCRCSVDGSDSNVNQPRSTTQAPPPTTLIPTSCHSPDGQDCQFYEKCLKAKYSCPFTRNWNDIIKFGSSMCNLPHYRKTSLSENGTLWITATQDCIQVQMAPLLKQWLNYHCSSLDSKSEVIFEQCLDKPLDKIEICDVSLEDLWGIFWTLRSEYNTNFVPSISKFYAKTRNCTRGTGGDSFRTLVIQFSPATYEKDFEVFVATVVESESWKEKGLFWYAEQRYNDDGPEIQLLFKTRKGATDRTTLEQALNDFADKLEAGTFKYIFNHRLIKPKAMYVCEDLGCNERAMEREATYSESKLSQDQKLTSHESSSSKQSTGLIILGVLGSIFLLVVVFGGIYYAYNKRKTQAFDHHRLVETS